MPGYEQDELRAIPVGRSYTVSALYQQPAEDAARALAKYFHHPVGRTLHVESLTPGEVLEVWEVVLEDLRDWAPGELVEVYGR